MKKAIICLFLFPCFFSAYAQNEGIGTNEPKARLHVTDSSIEINIPFLQDQIFSKVGYIW